MPNLKPDRIDKKYWTIGEVCAMFGINRSTISYWEAQFGTMYARRTGKKKARGYSAESIQNIRLVYNLLYTEGLTIEGAKKRILEIRKKVF